MLFLTDENIPITVVKSLRAKGHSVKDIKEERLFGLSDEEILKIASKENRVIITNDKDFLNLTKRVPSNHNGIIVIRFSIQDPKSVSIKLLEILDSAASKKFKNALVIISDKHIEIIR
ncbi:DUF5615 family PIN-like protein, partial [Candidatus Micrarchaeota archaeon]|nr:DUF5615 family PIN-like protein [Candidatus Micrarchaeota archaeon]